MIRNVYIYAMFKGEPWRIVGLTSPQRDWCIMYFFLFLSFDYNFLCMFFFFFALLLLFLSIFRATEGGDIRQAKFSRWGPIGTLSARTAGPECVSVVRSGVWGAVHALWLWVNTLRLHGKGLIYVWVDDVCELQIGAQFSPLAQLQSHRTDVTVESMCGASNVAFRELKWSP